jgi:hypothetical protein
MRTEECRLLGLHHAGYWLSYRGPERRPLCSACQPVAFHWTIQRSSRALVLCHCLFGSHAAIQVATFDIFEPISSGMANLRQM